MDDNRYQNREIDEKFDNLADKVDESSVVTREKIQSSHDALELTIRTNDKDYRESLSRIETQVSYTNGKVRKITVAIVLVGGILIGQTVTSVKDIIGLIAHFI